MAGLYRVTLKYAAAGVNMENVLYMSDGTRTAQQLCSYLGTEVGGECFVKFLAKAQLVGTTYQSIECLQMGHLILDPDFYQQAIAFVGERPGTDTNPQLAACVRLATGLSGRKRKGRFFLGGISEDDTQNGKLTAGGQGVIQARVNDCFALTNGQNEKPRWSVFSRSIYGGLSDIILDSYKPVTSLSVNLVLSTMRSRKPS